MRRGIVGAALALLTMLQPATAAPAAPPPTIVWVAERVSPRAPRIEIQAYSQWDRRGGRFVMVWAERERGRPRPVQAITWDTMGWDGPAAYRNGTTYGCPRDSGCDLLNGGGVSWFAGGVDAQYPQPDLIYLVVTGTSQEVMLVDSAGWRLRRTSLRARFALREDSAAVGVDVLGEHPEHFTHAALRGGPRGSIAVATPPCRPLHRSDVTREGHGAARLTGGTHPFDFDCHRDTITDLTAAADGPTTWSFDGDVVGNSTGPTRLTVIDL